MNSGIDITSNFADITELAGSLPGNGGRENLASADAAKRTTKNSGIGSLARINNQGSSSDSIAGN